MRLFLNGECIAAATSCTMHLQNNVENVSTKDDEGWVKNQVVSQSWDCSADAMVDNIAMEWAWDEQPTENAGSYGGKTLYAPDNAPFTVPADSSAVIMLSGGAGDKTIILGGNPPVTTPIAVSDNGIVVYQNDTHGEVSITPCALAPYSQSGDTFKVAFRAFGGVSLAELQPGTEVTIRMSTSQYAQNRIEADKLLEGDAIITDISISAANRQAGTYTVQLTGNGPLSIPEH